MPPTGRQSRPSISKMTSPSEITAMAELLAPLIRYVLFDSELSFVLFGAGLFALLSD
jgi:hypothetical protein